MGHPKIWTQAGIQPSGGWYMSAGQGMGATLAAAAAHGAYTLSDRATYLSRTSDDLVILVAFHEALLNSYRVLAVKPDRSVDGGDSANRLIDWLISVPVQEKIGRYGVEEFGHPLFHPDSQPWRNR